MVFVAVPGIVRNAVSRAHRVWESLKVEMHGKYSVERMRQLQSYSTSTSMFRVVMWVVITPLPCLAASIGNDLLPLGPPEQGLVQSRMAWRVFVNSAVVIHTLMQQCLQFMPSLPRLPLKQLAFTLASAGVIVAVTAVYEQLIGYPVPFFVPMTAPFVCTSMAVSLYTLGGQQIRESAEMRSQLLRFIVVLNAQISGIIIYPVFTYVFNLLSGPAQTMFALTLPLVKIAGKNTMSYLIQHAEDTKAEFVTFHVEIFHSIYMTTCLQNSTSVATSLAIALFDIVEACLALRDLQQLLDSIHKCVDEAARSLHEDRNQGHKPSSGGNDGVSGDAVSYTKSSVFKMNYLDAVLFLVQSDRGVWTNSTIRLQSDKRVGTRRISVQGPTSGIASNEVVTGDTSAKLKSALLPDGLDKQQPDAAELSTAGPVVLPGASPRANPARVTPLPLATATSTKIGWGSETQTLGSNEDATGSAAKIAAHLATPAATIAWPTSEIPGFGSVEPQDVSTLSLSDSDKRVLLAMNGATRLVFVQKVLQALYMSEILLLVEFVEVVIPCVYSAFIVSAFNLPNRDYYPRFKDATTDDLTRWTSNVMAFVVFEIVSLVILGVMVQRKLHISGLRQLAFVLETQWQDIQSKMILWVYLNLMALPVHYGVDFSFKFKWLRAPTTGR